MTLTPPGTPPPSWWLVLKVPSLPGPHSRQDALPAPPGSRGVQRARSMGPTRLA